MIEFLRGWIINIVIISILITILEAIIPNNSFKSYIKMVGGFLIIIALINPFIKLLTNNINIDKGVFSSIDVSSMNYSKEKINSSNEDQIEELYINNMTSAIKSSL
jgi:stage III sporulation protein AF